MSARAPSHLYVYYRFAGNVAEARATIGALFADVETRTGVCGRLLARRGDPATWMEVYEPVRDPRVFLRTLSACVRRAGAAGVAADGMRHVECFSALPGPPGGRARRRE